MSRKLRYIILAICCAIFAILAPTLVLFVRGQRIDLENERRVRSTGILAIETEPDDAELLLNGTLVQRTPASVRFLNPGDYTVEVRKQGYQPWQKKLPIFANKVAWASPNPQKITLLKEVAETEPLANGITAFARSGGGSVAIGAPQGIVVLSGTDYKNTSSIPLPESPVSLTSSPTGMYMLAQTKKYVLLVNTETGSFSNITKQAPLGSAFNFISNDTVAVLQNGQLKKIVLPNATEEPIASNVTSFAVLGNEIYFTQIANDANELFVVNTNSTATHERISNGLISSQNSKLFVTNQKHIFLLASGVLYRVNKTPEELARNVSNVYFDSRTNSLAFTVPGELSYYNFDENKIKLISRSNEPFTNVVLRRDINYAFYFQDNQLKAIELDDRDRQNNYVLKDVRQPTAFTFSAQNEIMLVDENSLAMLTIY